MSSLLRTAGELMIDHRASPGTRFVPEGKLIELPTYTCIHCCSIIVMHPNRTRERSLCMRCMAVICDQCAIVGECTPFIAQYIDTPGVIISTAGAPARVAPLLHSGLMLPGHITR